MTDIVVAGGPAKRAVVSGFFQVLFDGIEMGILDDPIIRGRYAFEPYVPFVRSFSGRAALDLRSWEQIEAVLWRAERKRVRRARQRVQRLARRAMRNAR